ncbi:Lrp/AsnC family transcriptional regulator, partial [Candidatus Micrarchaeota archaeon]|nr:Lrp/AsnC family transcriptional regulator [Candidatus Micrarchaeota archaeon]
KNMWEIDQKIDRLDRKILYELDLNSRISFKELGKKLKISKETASYRVKRLVKNGYIKNFITTISTSNLNRFYYKLFYKFHKTTPKIDREIIEFIQDYGSVAYFASLQGKYDITFLLLAKNMRDLLSFLTKFREKFGEYVLEQEILTMTSVHRFNFRFFYDRGELLHTKYPEELKEPKIDSLDYLIIKTLAQNSRIPLVELAKLGDTDINVIKYRFRKLKKLNILGTHVLDIRFDKFDVQHIQVIYTLKNHTVVNKLISYVAACPQSTFATVNLGRYDLVTEFVVKNATQLREILDGIKEKFSNDIISYDVFIMQEHSINWFPYQP